ncbi:MAG: hypothetical protein FJY29_09720 [Betaproteobacteria bacterium]|nr:hypothetical protein [Betaproteobacteria bacterium]
MISEYAGDWLFLQSKLGFGLYHFELSDTQYSTVYKNWYDKYGFKRASGTEPVGNMYIELGTHASFDLTFGRVLATLGYYYLLPPATLRLVKMNTTNTDYHFTIQGSPHHGFSGQIATAF